MAKLFRVILPVTDLDRAAVIYSDLVDTGGERVSPGRHYFNLGGVVLALYNAASDGDGSVEPTRYQPGQYFYLAVADLEETLAKAQSSRNPEHPAPGFRAVGIAVGDPNRPGSSVCWIFRPQLPFSLYAVADRFGHQACR